MVLTDHNYHFYILENIKALVQRCPHMNNSTGIKLSKNISWGAIMFLQMGFHSDQ